MISLQHNFKGVEIPSTSITSLGTPEQVEKYIYSLNNNSIKQFGFLFDLDGTIVFTDDIYLNVWKTILEKYNITLDIDMFKNYIQGNNDLYVCNTLLYNVKITLEELSTLKDLLFIKYIDEIKIVPGIVDFFKNIKENGNKIAIVTNCNRIVAETIIKKLNFDKYIDLLIISNECKNSKPYPDPYLKAIENLNISNNNCFIFEDSKTGLLSAKSISPKELIAIKTNQTSYTNDEYKSLNVSRIIKDYTQITVNEFINDKCNIEDQIKNNILYSIKKQNIFQNEPIESIIVDSSKLKGGYITDALKVTIKTLFHSYDCVLKLENKNSSFLSKMANDLGLYEREYYFYKYISSSVSIPIPKFYCLVYSENNPHSTIGILLENLYTKGCKINLDLNIESIDTTLQVVSDCAKLHSTFWNKNCFSELKRHNDSAFQPKWKDFINERWNTFKDKWKISLSDYHITLSEYIVNNFNSIQNYLSEGNLTLCHGDVKSPNIFYLQTSTNIYSPYFIDWQYIAYGKGVQDIVFFLIESFDINSIQDIAYLVKNYYYLKCKEFGVKNYTLEEYNKDFIYSILYFPFFVCIWFGTLSQEDLIDKNFPFFFIQKFFNFIDIFKHDINKVLSIY